MGLQLRSRIVVMALRHGAVSRLFGADAGRRSSRRIIAGGRPAVLLNADAQYTTYYSEQ